MNIELFVEWIKNIYLLFIDDIYDINDINELNKCNRIIIPSNENQLIEFTINDFMYFFHNCFLTIDINIILGAFSKLENGKRSNNLIYYWLLKNETHLESINNNQALSTPLTLKSMKEQYNKYINKLSNIFISL